ncbi:uncharacterized protein CC84DRAFT_1161507 [Paraphaeosphaeria sporulosa]|uniref:Uncharacterized protein n=1 Tax=Paraphaeosphaeria sporulosa TaxID=1460663 RepID=A0A177CTT3_9PLEO|nr:uncharacterized protein CC84DRAFT_1161507 [Paraphaeosphaeria sporulosa]OAG10601.1 hypothetical protein CC84DRAFT_1161507 [Paraphaeosphaeria sporulosa]
MQFYRTLALAALAGLVSASPIAIEGDSIAVRSGPSLDIKAPIVDKRGAQGSGLVEDDDFEIPDEPDTKRAISVDDEDNFDIPDEPDTKRAVLIDSEDDFVIPDEPDTKRAITVDDDDFDIPDEPDTKRAVAEDEDDFEIPDEPDN